MARYEGPPENYGDYALSPEGADLFYNTILQDERWLDWSPTDWVNEVNDFGDLLYSGDKAGMEDWLDEHGYDVAIQFWRDFWSAYHAE